MTLSFVPDVKVDAVKLVVLDSAIPAPPTDNPAPPIRFVDVNVPTPAEYCRFIKVEPVENVSVLINAFFGTHVTDVVPSLKDSGNLKTTSSAVVPVAGVYPEAKVKSNGLLFLIVTPVPETRREVPVP